MAAWRGGAAYWVACLRNHGNHQFKRQPSWIFHQMLEQPVVGSSRTLCSVSWALAPPNSLRYQNLKTPSLSHPFHHASQPQSTAATGNPDEHWDETVSLCVLLRERDHDEHHTLVEVTHLGQAKLSELLALGPGRPLEFLLPLTTVDGSREDDINVTGRSQDDNVSVIGRGQDDEKRVTWRDQDNDIGLMGHAHENGHAEESWLLGKEPGSFRSLFEAEGCPAPFVMGSRFYCFHCTPGVASDTTSGPSKAGLEHGQEALVVGANPPLPSPSLSQYQDEDSRVPPSSSNREQENEEQLAIMYERLRVELPRFFIRNHDYGLYANDMEFINGLINTKTRGRVLYQLTVSLWRALCLCYYAEAHLEVLKLTKHPEDGSIRARWRIRGLPFHLLLLRFYKKDKTRLYRTYDAFSTFYLGSDGLIHCHRVEKVMQAQPPVLPRVTSLLAGALVALGFQENRPALNLFPFLLASQRQERE